MKQLKFTALFLCAKSNFTRCRFLLHLLFSCRPRLSLCQNQISNLLPISHFLIPHFNNVCMFQRRESINLPQRPIKLLQFSIKIHLSSHETEQRFWQRFIECVHGGKKMLPAKKNYMTAINDEKQRRRYLALVAYRRINWTKIIRHCFMHRDSDWPSLIGRWLGQKWACICIHVSHMRAKYFGHMCFCIF